MDQGVGTIRTRSLPRGVRHAARDAQRAEQQCTALLPVLEGDGGVVGRWWNWKQALGSGAVTQREGCVWGWGVAREGPEGEVSEN